MKKYQIIHEFKLFLDYWGIRKEYLEETKKESDISYFYDIFKNYPSYKYITHLFYWYNTKNGTKYWHTVYLLWDMKLKELGEE